MVTLSMNEQATRAASVVNRRRLLRCNVCVCDTVTPNDYGFATWRAPRVLIVDHQQDIAGGLFSLAGRWVHAFRMAYHDGQATLNLSADEHPDVVLLNLELPSVDGRRLASQLRLDALRSDCFIIALADWADDERRRQCGEAGIDLLLVKPMDPSVLDVLLGLEWVRINRQRAAEAGSKHYCFNVESQSRLSSTSSEQRRHVAFVKRCVPVVRLRRSCIFQSLPNLVSNQN